MLKSTGIGAFEGQTVYVYFNNDRFTNLYGEGTTYRLEGKDDYGIQLVPLSGSYANQVIFVPWFAIGAIRSADAQAKSRVA